MIEPFGGHYRISAGYQIIPTCSNCRADILVAYSLIPDGPLCEVCSMPYAPRKTLEAIRAMQRQSRARTPGLLSLLIEASDKVRA